MVKQISYSNAKTAWHNAYQANDIHIPFLSYEWHTLWYRVFEQIPNAYILQVNDCIAPFVRVGDVVQFSGGEEIADYLDLLGPNEQKEKAWEHILTFLQHEGVTSLHLRNVPESSPSFSFFSHHTNTIVQKEDTTPIIQLPATWEHYLEILTRKYRHELERKIRKFEREHIDAVITESKNPKEDVNKFLTLMTKDHAKQTFLTPAMRTFFTEMTNTFSSDISLLFLSMGDNTAAATLAFKTNQAYFLYNSGYDRACCANGGFYLKAQSIRRAIEHGLKEYNFLQGSERYKYELGGKDFGVYTIDVQL